MTGGPPTVTLAELEPRAREILAREQADEYLSMIEAFLDTLTRLRRP
jgi:hypothetical protein